MRSGETVIGPEKRNNFELKSQETVLGTPVQESALYFPAIKIAIE
jgi:hypothetical protein